MTGKKLISMLMTIIFLVACLSISAVADEVITITSPTAAVQNDFDTVTFNSPTGTNVSVMIDGVEKAFLVSQGEDSVKLDEPLTVGDHKLTIIAFDDVQSVKKEMMFSVTLEEEVVHNNDDFNDKVNYSTNGEGVAGTSPSGGDARIITWKPDDAEENSGGALGFRFTDEFAYTTQKVCFLQTAVGNATEMKPLVYFEYDLMLTSPNGAFEVETHGAKGYGTLGANKIFVYNGKIGSTDIYYPVNEWMHVKHILNLQAQTEIMYVNDDKILERNIPNQQFNGLDRFKFQYYAVNGKPNQGFAVDNVKVTSYGNYQGVTGASYDVGNGTFVPSVGDVIDINTKKVKLDFASSPITGTDIEKYVTLSVDGIEVTPSSVAFQDNAILVELPESLAPQSDVYVKYDDGFYQVDKKLISSYNEIGVDNIAYEIGGKPVYSERQLKNSKNVKMNVWLTNKSAAEKKCLLVAAVYDGSVAVGVKVKEVTLGAGSSSPSAGEVFEIPMASNNDKQSIELYLVNNLSEKLALSKVWTMNEK